MSINFMNKSVLALIVAILIAGGAIFFINQQNQSQSSQQFPPTTAVIEPTQPEGAMEEKEEGAVKIFKVNGTPFSFSVKEMRVKQGERVKVEFTNKQGFHDWTLDEFNVKTKQLQAGQSETVEFVANKKGTFEYYCGVGNHRAQGMVGKLIVE